MPLYIPGTATAAQVLAGSKFSAGPLYNADGTMPNITSGSDAALSIGQWPDGGIAVYPREGYRKGGSGAGEIKVNVDQLQATIANLSAGNIKAGVPLLGLTGSLVSVPYATGTFSASGTVSVKNTVGQTFSYELMVVTGLSFTPDYVIWWHPDGSTRYALSVRTKTFISMSSLSWAAQYFWLNDNPGIYAAPGTFHVGIYDGSPTPRTYIWQAWGSAL